MKVVQSFARAIRPLAWGGVRPREGMGPSGIPGATASPRVPLVRRAFLHVSRSARRRRAELFNRELKPAPHDAVLDLGGGKGDHFAAYFPAQKNVVVADISEADLEKARRRYGFRTAALDGTDILPFKDKEFDIVFCSSVIEHVTGPKDEAVELFKTSGRAFRAEAWRHQERFAAEVRRIAKSYFVQTPSRGFLVESHSWIPLIAGLPTHLQWRVIAVFNRFWPRKKHRPDWALLNDRELRRLFPEATIHRERVWWLWTKSFIAIHDARAKSPQCSRSVPAAATSRPHA